MIYAVMGFLAVFGAVVLYLFIKYRTEDKKLEEQFKEYPPKVVVQPEAQHAKQEMPEFDPLVGGAAEVIEEEIEEVVKPQRVFKKKRPMRKKPKSWYIKHDMAKESRRKNRGK